MKKGLKSVLMGLLVVMIVTMSSCGKNDTDSGTTDAVTPTESATEASTESEAPGAVLTDVWSVGTTVDEFGDVTENSVDVIHGYLEGTFNNTATKNSDFTGNVWFEYDSETGHYVAVLELFEYGNNPVSLLAGSEIAMKIKVDDEIMDIDLDKEESMNYFYIGNKNCQGDLLFMKLDEGTDIRCIINVESSQYNFSMDSGNFHNIVTENSFVPVTEIDESAYGYLNDKEKYIVDEIRSILWSLTKETVTLGAIEERSEGEYYIDLYYDNKYNTSLKIKKGENLSLARGNYAQVPSDDFNLELMNKALYESRVKN